MKVLVYAHSFAPNVGGAETAVMLLARGLAERSGGRLGRAGDARGLDRVTVATRAEAAAGFDDRALPFGVVRRPGLRRLWGLIGEADVVHLAGPVWLPLALSLLKGKPVVVEHHGYQAICPNGLLFLEPQRSACPGHFMARRYGRCLRCAAAGSSWRKGLSKLLLTFPRHWLCTLVAANVGITDHVSRRLGLPAARTIYYGVPNREDGTSRTHRPSRGRFTFAYVGRLVGEKGLPLLLRAAALLRGARDDFHVAFIGDGPERGHLESMVRDLGLSDFATFTGFLQGRALEDTLAGVSAVVMPSVWEETAGLAAIEHMMRGRLVIAADIGGLGEVVDTAGLRFSPGDVDGLAACMRRALEDPALVTALGAKARQRALENFRQDRMVEEHLLLYSTVCPERS